MNAKDFAQLYDDNHSLLYFWVLKRARNRERSEDVCALAFAQVFAKRQSVTEFKSYLFKCAERIVMNEHRHESLIKWEPIPAPDEWGENEPSDPRDFTVELEHWYEWQRAANAALLCSEAERRALAGILRGDKVRQVARSLGIPPGSAGRQIASAKRKVRDLCEA